MYDKLVRGLLKKESLAVFRQQEFRSLRDPYVARLRLGDGGFDLSGDQLMHRQFRKAFHLTINVLMFTSALSSAAIGQSGKPLPENAEAGRYGSGWECKRGFRRQDDSCLEVKLPDHAYRVNTTYGKGWNCHYGFVEESDQCIAVQVPANAYLDPYFGDSWQCLSGYRRSNVGCDLIKVPENAFLSETAGPRGWECERGYLATELSCVKIEVPEHAYLTSSGDKWRCGRGFEEKDKACVCPPSALMRQI